MSWSREGPWATVAMAHSARALAEAVRQEMRAWDEGLRDVQTIADHWRQQASAENVCQRMLRVLLVLPAAARPTLPGYLEST